MNKEKPIAALKLTFDSGCQRFNKDSKKADDKHKQRPQTLSPSDAAGVIGAVSSTWNPVASTRTSFGAKNSNILRVFFSPYRNAEYI